MLSSVSGSRPGVRSLGPVLSGHQDPDVYDVDWSDKGPQRKNPTWVSTHTISPIRSQRHNAGRGNSKRQNAQLIQAPSQTSEPVSQSRRKKSALRYVSLPPPSGVEVRNDTNDNSANASHSTAGSDTGVSVVAVEAAVSPNDGDNASIAKEASTKAQSSAIVNREQKLVEKPQPRKEGKLPIVKKLKDKNPMVDEAVLPPEHGPNGKRKRKSSVASRETNAKRPRTSPTRGVDAQSHTTEISEEEESASADAQGLSDQWKALRMAWARLKSEGLNNLQEPKKRIAQEFKGLCSTAMKKLRSLSDASEVSEDGEDPPVEFERIGEIISELCGEKGEKRVDFKSKHLIHDIYYNVIPALTHLVVYTIKCYETLDVAQPREGLPITIDHLRIVTNLIDHAVKIGTFINDSSIINKPDAVGAVIKSTHRDATIPLRTASKIFTAHLHAHDRALARSTALATQVARAAHLETQAARHALRRQHLATVRAHWAALHAARRAVEGIIPAPKQHHLRIPRRETEPDFDAHGFPLAREFDIDRVGPPFASIERARAQLWTTPELLALHDGLRDFAGPGVFGKIFRKFCGRTGALNRFNVTEIVVTAAELKEKLKRAQSEGEEAEEVEAWVEMIPEWTKPHAIGVENEVRDVGEGDGME